MASLLSWLGKEASAVYHQINPFDNGQTYSTVMNNRPPLRPLPQQQRPQQQPQQQQGPQLQVRPVQQAPLAPVVPNYHVAIAPPQVHVAPPQLLHLGNQIIQPNPQARSGVQAPPPPPNLAQQVASGLSQKLGPTKQALSFVQHNVVQPVAHAAVEIPASITNQSFHPGNPVEQAVLGKQPVAPVQQDVRGVYQAVKAGHQNLPGGIPISPSLAGPYALATAALHLGQDIPLAKGATTIARAGLKDVAPVAKAAIEKRVPLNAMGAVGKDVSNHPVVQAFNKHYTPAANPTPAETAAANYVRQNPDKAMADYNTRVADRFGTQKIAAGDEAKHIIAGFDSTKSVPYHEPGSALAKVKAEHLLSDTSTAHQPVMLMSGGTGAGKTSSLLKKFNLDDYALTHDTNANKLNSAKQKIDAALQTGRPVQVVHVHRDLLDAFRNGVIPRTKTEGRIIDPETHVDTHFGANQVFKQLQAHYEGNPKVGFSAFGNVTGKDPVPLAKIPDIGYNKSEALQQLRKEVHNAHQQGTISTAERNAYLAKEQRQPSTHGPNGQSNDGGSQQGVRLQVPQDQLQSYLAQQGGSPQLRSQEPNLTQAQHGGSPSSIPALPQANGPVGARLTTQDANKLAKQLTTPPQSPKINTPMVGTKPLGLTKTIATSPQTTAGLSRDIQGSYNPLSNKSAMGAAGQRIAQDPNAAYQFAASTHSAEGNATAIQLAKQLESQGKHDQAANLMVEKAKQALQAGQGNQIYSLWDKLSPETVAQTAAKTIEKYNQTARSPVPQLTPEQYKNFVEQAKHIQGLPEGSRAKGVATQNLMKQIGQLVPSSKTDKAFSLYRTGLLTGFRTPGKVLVSHGVSSGFEQAKNIPAKVADTVIGVARAPFIGKYQRGLSVTPRGNLAGAAKGTFAAVDNFIHGYDAPGSGGIAHDFANDTHFNTKTLHGKIAQAYVNAVGHLHGSLYKPFYGAQHLNSLYDMAITNAQNQGLRGAERSSFVQKFVKDATSASLKDQTQNAHADFTTPEGAAQRANAEAAYTTFQNKTLLSEAAAGLKSKTPGARYIVPFSQIPSSIASKVVDYSPAGAIKEAIAQAKNGSFDQRALSQAIGRSSTGTGLTALGYHLYNSGNITTAYPTDKKEQAQWKLEGKQANSVKVGGKWRQLASLGPAGDTLAVGANAAEGMKGNKKTPGSLTNAAIQGGVGGINVLGNSPYLQGIQNIGAAISSPGTKAQKVVEGLAGGAIPAGVANIASATDSQQRQTNSPVDAVTNKIPGLREKNLPQVDVLGRNLPRAQGALGSLLDPFYSTTAKTDPVTSELNRLNGTYNPATPSAITKNQSIHGQKVDLNPRDLTALQQQSGKPLNQALGQLITSKLYAQASDQNKANTISDVTTAVRDAVKNGQAVDLNSILDKAQKTLTKDIFKDSGQASQTIGNTVYKRGKNGEVTTSKVKPPKATKAKTPRAKSTRTTRTTSGASTRGTSRTTTTKAATAVKVPSFKITGAKAFRPPKGVKIRVAKTSFKAPRVQKISVASIPNVNKRRLG